jgi:hypothetical protein
MIEVPTNAQQRGVASSNPDQSNREDIRERGGLSCSAWTFNPSRWVKEALDDFFFLAAVKFEDPIGTSPK